MDALPTNRSWPPSCSHGTYQHKAITSRGRQLLMMGTWLPETCWSTIRREIKITQMWHLVGFSYPHWITMHGQPHIRFAECVPETTWPSHKMNNWQLDNVKCCTQDVNMAGPHCCAFYLCMCPVSSSIYTTVSPLLILSWLAVLGT